jgi:DNA-directed RNA polymerase specialized sigma24 family protein
MNSITFEKLRTDLQAGNPAAFQELLEACEPYCVPQLQQKANCSRQEAEEILIEALLIFREKVLDKRVVAVANLREYLFLTCWERWRERQRGDGAAPDILSRFQQVGKQRFDREVEGEIQQGDLLEYDQLWEASRWAMDRLEPEGQRILKLFYHQHCSFEEIANFMNLRSATEAQQLKSHYYDRWMNAVTSLMQS